MDSQLAEFSADLRMNRSTHLFLGTIAPYLKWKGIDRLDDLLFSQKGLRGAALALRRYDHLSLLLLGSRSQGAPPGAFCEPLGHSASLFVLHFQ